MTRAALLAAAIPATTAVGLAVYAWLVERRTRIEAAKWRHPSSGVIVQLDRYRRQSGG